LFSSHPNGERDREDPLNYYASAYTKERQLSHFKTKPNTTKHQNYDLWPGNGVVTILVEREGIDKKRK